MCLLRTPPKTQALLCAFASGWRTRDAAILADGKTLEQISPLENGQSGALPKCYLRSSQESRTRTVTQLQKRRFMLLLAVPLLVVGRTHSQSFFKARQPEGATRFMHTKGTGHSSVHAYEGHWPLIGSCIRRALATHRFMHTKGTGHS
jgi:hypothetical protein